MVHWPVLPAQVVGAAGNVGQRADQVVAALERRLQQHGTNLLYLLHTHTGDTAVAPHHGPLELTEDQKL